MLDYIKFKGYKVFKDSQILELKPVTVIFGKNSSGKSAILKLLLLVESIFIKKQTELLKFYGGKIELGGEFRDLVYGRSPIGRIKIVIGEQGNQLELELGTEPKRADKPEILSCVLNGEELLTEGDLQNFFDLFKSQGFNFSLKVDYISSFREGNKRYWDAPSENPTTIGTKGENVYNILLADTLTREKKLLKGVSSFYEKNFEGWGIRINEENAPPYQIELENGNLKINFVDVGLGMVHALPLVVQALMPITENMLFIIEEPEQHLHPAAHGNLAQLFAESIYKKKLNVEDISESVYSGKKYLIETHSQNFVLRLRRLVAEGKLDAKDVAIYYVDFDEEKFESSLIKMTIDEEGKTRNDKGEIYWPHKIFSETLDETTAIRTAQLNKRDAHDS